MVKKEIAKEKAKTEKPVKPATKPVKARPAVGKYHPSAEELEHIAKALDLKIQRTGHRITLWTGNGIRIAKFANGTTTLTQPTQQVIHPANEADLQKALKDVMPGALAKVKHIPIPPKREKKEKTSPEEKVKAKVKVATKQDGEKKPAPKPPSPIKKPAPKQEK